MNIMLSSTDRSKDTNKKPTAVLLNRNLLSIVEITIEENPVGDYTLSTITIHLKILSRTYH